MSLRFGLAALLLLLLTVSLDHAKAPQRAPKSFPDADFFLRDKDLKPPKSGVVLGPMRSDGKGGTTGSFAIYGGGLPVEVSSLSFSGDGKLLAVGSTPNIVDLWDVESRKKLLSLKGGTAVGLSLDGYTLAIDGKGIELYDVTSGVLKKRIPRTPKRPENVIDSLTFNPDGTLLAVTANGDEDMIFEASSGRLIVTLPNTQHSQFSKDGSLLIGGNAKHLIVWSTKDWSKVSDLPNGPDYIRRIAACPEKDLVIVGGPKEARLLRLGSGEELAKVSTGWTNFASFNQTGTLIFTYATRFNVWDASGKQICSRPDIGNGTVALSPNDRWMAGAPVKEGTTVAIWDLQKALKACGI